MNVIRSGSDLAETAAGVIADALRDATTRNGHATFAVSGGRTPGAVFEALSAENVPWELTDVFQVDERVAPPGDEARNRTGLTGSFLDRVPVGFHPMPVESEDLVAAATRYADQLPQRLDVVHLGLGDDGHTASLVPGDPAVDVEDRDVAVTGVYRGHHRMTLTRPVLDRAGLIVWIVSGDDKAGMVERLISADPAIPAGLISQERAVLITNSI